MLRSIRKCQNDGPALPCPRCGARGAKRLVYGLVDYEWFLELGEREPDFELGGLTAPDYDWRCPHCGHEWRNSG